MSDIVERLRDSDTTRRVGESYADVHERRQRDRDEAAYEIERLRAALALFACDCAVNERCAIPDNCRNFQARRCTENVHDR